MVIDCFESLLQVTWIFHSDPSPHHITYSKWIVLVLADLLGYPCKVAFDKAIHSPVVSITQALELQDVFPVQFEGMLI